MTAKDEEPLVTYRRDHFAEFLVAIKTSSFALTNIPKSHELKFNFLVWIINSLKGTCNCKAEIKLTNRLTD